MGKGASKLRPGAVADLTESTNFTAEEIRVWYKNFLKECPGGQLTVAQFKQVYAKNFPEGDASAFAEQVFRTFDKDESRTIDFREFMCAMNVTSRGNTEEKLTWAFDMYDIDGDGSISWEETEKIVHSIYKMTRSIPSDKLDKHVRESTKKIFECMDVNRDGVITQEEFVQGVHADPSIIKLLTKEG